MTKNSDLIKGSKWLFAGHFDEGQMEGGAVQYQGSFTYDEAVTYVENSSFDWAHLVEERFGELVIIAFLNEDGENGWLVPSEVDDDIGGSYTP